MWLPTPSDEAVNKFKDLVERETGRTLSDGEARQSATRVLHLVFLKTYGSSYLREEVERERRASSSEP